MFGCVCVCVCHPWFVNSSKGGCGFIVRFFPIGSPSIVECRILNNRRQVVTRDNKKNVMLWDILHVRELADVVLAQTHITDDITLTTIVNLLQYSSKQNTLSLSCIGL